MRQPAKKMTLSFSLSCGIVLKRLRRVAAMASRLRPSVGFAKNRAGGG